MDEKLAVRKGQEKKGEGWEEKDEGGQSSGQRDTLSLFHTFKMGWVNQKKNRYRIWVKL